MKAVDIQNMEIALGEIANELERAIGLHGPMNSLHEAYAVILEELDEVWDHVKLKQSLRDMKEVRKELIQTAAMCVKTIIQICDTNNKK